MPPCCRGEPIALHPAGCGVKKFTNDVHMMDDINNNQFLAARSDDGPTEPISFPQPTIGNCELRSTLRAYDPTDGTVIVSEGSGYAYWLRTTLRKAIYGSVVHCPVLTRSSSPSSVNADWVITKMECAIKIVELEELKSKGAAGEHRSENPLKEIAAVQHLMSTSSSTPQHVLSIFEAVQDEDNLYIVMPFCRDGELFDLVSDNASFDEIQTRSIMKQILVGVKAMHDAGICHRDLSLENVLLHEGNCQIIDFGLCLRVPQHEGLRRDTKSIRMKPQGKCGKLFYMAPEIYENTDAFNPYAIDVWSLGAMLFMMLTSSPPYDRPSPTDDMFVWFMRGEMEEIIKAWGLQLSSEVIDLMSGMMCVDPEKRLTLSEVLEHPWMKNL
eukprot:CAMPEP_0116047290 /NCGR_PEP_ID=MMETSP0321-20121206/28785_1 /TAXON_ID=163516 /ORGANISM="Leptocylindrus danicus var. danicus, Strain B650" /LENGTH=383 /DNA_ID=CAMNT_0003529105 /DNA_START=24 /DNA_END=1176 /DNA_ORIENTATION=-